MSTLFSFKFKPKTIKLERARTKKIILNKVTGVILNSLTEDNKYYIKLDIDFTKAKELHLTPGNAVLPLSDDSYSCKGKPDIWLKHKDSKTGYIRIVRNENSFAMGECPEPYLPFRPGLIGCGKIINTSEGMRFKLIRCTSKSQLLERAAHINHIVDSND